MLVATIRPVSANDIYAVIHLAYDLLPERYTNGVFTTFYETFPDGFLVAIEDGKVVGFCVGIISGEGQARILMLAIDPLYQRRRIASGLVTTLLATLKHHRIHTVALEVMTTNRQAILFYQSCGFAIAERIKRFYVTGADAFVMTKHL